ncbi:MAG: efflux RND transporter periplasmic adaptor subunit [Lachnospiraceae bacterium]|nr:efflux RND transporter periplasmic adaptor subunit [Lachnospiraceae bacterium]
MKRKSKSMIGLVLGVGLCLTGCGSTAQEQTAGTSAVLVDVETAGKGSLVLSNQFVGTISPEKSVYIIPLAQGTVTETFFEVGDEVQAGDVLFKIDDSGAKLQLRQAQLTYNNTKLQADSALTTQQESANMQLDTSISGAEAQYVAAQAQWKAIADQYDEIDDIYDQADEAYEKVKEIWDQAKAAGLTSVSSGDIVINQAYVDDLKSKRDQAKTTRDKIEPQLNAAEKAMEVAGQAYETAKKSKELTQGDVLEDTKKQLNTGLQLAGLGVDSAELALSYYQVTTPISGKVTGKNVEVNGMATSASPAYVIANDNTMNVTYNVSEAVKNTLTVGQNIIVERNGVEYTGVITEVANAVNQATGLFQVKAAVQANGEQLPSGVSVKISSETYKAENDLIIPYDAVYYDNKGAYVYVVDNGTAVKTYVTTGIFNDEEIQILDGISEGTKIVTSWSPRLMDGVQITAHEAQEAK